MAFAHYPPGETTSLMVRLWDRHLPRWRDVLRRDDVTERVTNPKLAEAIKRMTDAPSLNRDQVDFDPHDPESLAIQRFVGRRKGSWRQLPKDLEEPEDLEST